MARFCPIDGIDTVFFVPEERSSKMARINEGRDILCIEEIVTLCISQVYVYKEMNFLA
jgi:hypothetical protein